MSKRLVIKYPECYQTADRTNIVQPTTEIELADAQYVKKLSVDRITFPKGFLFEGEAWLLYNDSEDNLYSIRISDAGVNCRRFLDIWHAGFEIQRWFDAINGLSPDTLESTVDDSKAYIAIKSTYTGGNTPYLFINSIDSKTSTENTGFSRYVSECIGIPHYDAYIDFPTSGDFIGLPFYDGNAGVDEIYMTSETLAAFEEKYSTEFDRYELNSSIMTIPAPSISYYPKAEIDTYGEHTPILKWYVPNDARLYERKTYNVSDMLTPFVINFDSQLTIKDFDLHFYADIGGSGLYPIYFPAAVGLVINTESSEAIEKEEEVERLPYEEDTRVI